MINGTINSYDNILISLVFCPGTPAYVYSARQSCLTARSVSCYCPQNLAAFLETRGIPDYVEEINGMTKGISGNVFENIERAGVFLFFWLFKLLDFKYLRIFSFLKKWKKN